MIGLKNANIIICYVFGGLEALGSWAWFRHMVGRKLTAESPQMRALISLQNIRKHVVSSFFLFVSFLFALWFARFLETSWRNRVQISIRQHAKQRGQEKERMADRERERERETHTHTQ